jgi:hypothetical protein
MLFLCFVPDSPEWRRIWTGHISAMAYGRNWDRFTGSIKEAQSVAREIFECMCAIRCEELYDILIEINAGIQVIAEKTGNIQQETDPPIYEGTPPVGPGTPYPDQKAYLTAKCNAANAIYDTVSGLVDWLDDNDVELITGSLGGITSGLAIGFAVAGPLGWVWGLVSFTVVTFAGLLITSVINFADLSAALGETHQGCVQGLFNAGSVGAAETNFINAVKGATTPITSTEETLLQLMLTNELLNQLFTIRSDIAAYTSAGPIDCSGGLLISWDFDSDYEGWTFTDVSDPSCSATRSYEATNEGVKNDIVVASLPNVTGAGENKSPTINLAVTPGAAIQADFLGPSDAPLNEGIIIKAIYTDATEEEQHSVINAPATVTFTLTQSKTLDYIAVWVGRSTSQTAKGSSHYDVMTEVRLYSA